MNTTDIIALVRQNERQGADGLAPQRFGHASNNPCTVCGGFDDNQCEPRFGYTVCVAHQRVAPVDIDAARKAHEAGK